MNYHNPTILSGLSIPFSVELSHLIGRTPALFLQQLHYWLQKSKHLIDDIPWIYNTLNDWAEQLGCSTTTIKRVIARLKHLEIIQIDRRKQSEWDQTNWYTIDYKSLEALIFRSGPLCSTGGDHFDPIDQTKMVSSSSLNKKLPTTNSPPPHPLVDEDNQLTLNQKSEFSSMEENQVTASCDLQQVEGSGEDQSSAEGQPDFLKKITDAIAPQPLTPYLKRLVLTSSVEILNNAIAAYQEAKEENRVKHPIKYMISAIKHAFTPNKQASPMLSDFTRWFNEAYKAGLVVASYADGARIRVLTRSDEWVWWDEIKHLSINGYSVN